MSVVRHDVNLPAVCLACGEPSGAHYPGCHHAAGYIARCRACGAREGEPHRGSCTSPWPTFSAHDRGTAPVVTK